jgi:xanthine dehydrogenase iron-sulfur cluster and FAD-binding subunit A
MAGHFSCYIRAMNNLRSLAERRADVLHRLETDRDAWVATASRDGRPHLVPLSLAWDGQRVICATPTDSVTARNARATGRVRLALGDTRDVVVIDATAELQDVRAGDEVLGELFAERNDWDPRKSASEDVWLLMMPERIQAWRSEAELEGRTIMKNGAWRL